MDRRDFLKTSATAVIPIKNATAANAKENKEFVGVLVDTTRCIGCRSCEVACSEANSNFVPDVKSDNALEKVRDTSDKQFTVVNRFNTEKCWRAMKIDHLNEVLRAQN